MLDVVFYFVGTNNLVYQQKDIEFVKNVLKNKKIIKLYQNTKVGGLKKKNKIMNEPNKNGITFKTDRINILNSMFKKGILKFDAKKAEIIKKMIYDFEGKINYEN